MLFIICWNFLRWFLLRLQVFFCPLLVCGGMISIVWPHHTYIWAIQDLLRSIFCVTRAQAGISWHTMFVSSFARNNGDFFYYRRSSRLVYGLITDRSFFCTHATCSHCCGTKYSPTVSHDSSTPPSTHLRHDASSSFFERVLFVFPSFIHHVRTINLKFFV